MPYDVTQLRVRQWRCVSFASPFLESLVSAVWSFLIVFRKQTAPHPAPLPEVFVEMGDDDYIDFSKEDTLPSTLRRAAGTPQSPKATSPVRPSTSALIRAASQAHSAPGSPASNHAQHRISSAALQSPTVVLGSSNEYIDIISQEEPIDDKVLFTALILSSSHSASNSVPCFAPGRHSKRRGQDSRLVLSRRTRTLMCLLLRAKNSILPPVTRSCLQRIIRDYLCVLL
eukprot:m.626069 g.626069  ORF g.626069 m.626069 type:complete len:228 (+) comp58239_c2_seq18:935-1618(+)